MKLRANRRIYNFYIYIYSLTANDTITRTISRLGSIEASETMVGSLEANARGVDVFPSFS